MAGDELVHAWRSVTQSISPDKITHRSIKSLLFPPTEQDLPTTTIKVTPTLHEDIHREAAERGLSIVELIKTMFEFFVRGGNSHSVKDDVDNTDYAEKERIWREDLAELVASNKVESEESFFSKAISFCGIHCKN